MTKRLTKDALLLAVALILYAVEAQIPPLVPVPGVKLGLANIVTVWAMFRVGAKDTLAILALRVILGSIWAGQIISFTLSLAGALVCYLVMLLLKRILTMKQIWICSAVAAVAHNIGQTAAAIPLFRTASVAVYLPFLVLSGLLTGLFTGLCAQLLIRYLPQGKTERE